MFFESVADVVLLGAIIKYMIDTELYFHDYVVSYTNASSIISPDYQDTEDLVYETT